jgi:hypothetical protein
LAVLVAFTVAPGIAAPLGSVTVPERVARYSCANAEQATMIIKQTRLLLIVRARYQIANEIAGRSPR